LTDEGLSTRPTRKAGVCGVPVHSVVAHLTLVDADSASAGIAGLGVEGLETQAAVGTRRSHDVPFTSEMSLTLKTLEVTHVPTLTLRLSALVREYYLNTTPNGMIIQPCL